jgi:hypothetical protein
MGMRRYAVVLAAVVASLAACSPAPAQHARASSTDPTVPANQLYAAIRNVTYSGDYCPPGSAAIGYPDGNPAAFTVTFSTGLVLAADTPIAASCKIVADLDVPAGYQLKKPMWFIRGYTQVTASLWRGYSVGDVPPETERSDDNMPGNEDYGLTDRAPDVWSPTCDGSQRTSVVMRLTGCAHDPGDGISIDSVDSDTSFAMGSDWRRCGDTDPIVEPPGVAGESCAGPHQRPCASGLVCELDATPLPGRFGTCVDPNQVVPPAAKNAVCGGVRHIACQDGLTCWWLSQSDADADVLGRCVAMPADAGSPCHYGVPALECTDGLYCLFNSRSGKCVVATGELSSPCGDGLPACKSPLQCYSNACDHPHASEGQPCGGPDQIVCNSRLVCKKASPSDDTGVCVKR